MIQKFEDFINESKTYKSKDGDEIEVGDIITPFDSNLGGYTVLRKMPNGKLQYQIGETIDYISPNKVKIIKKFKA